jgi:hypothetical protein
MGPIHGGGVDISVADQVVNPGSSEVVLGQDWHTAISSSQLSTARLWSSAVPRLDGCHAPYRTPPQSKLALWPSCLHEVFTSDGVASENLGPQPPPEWAPALKQLTELSRAPLPAPAWWTPRAAYRGSIESRVDPASYHRDRMTRLGRGEPPLFIFQFTLASWGHFQLRGTAPRQVPPGAGFFAVIPSDHCDHLPKDSPGWTFGRLAIYHPFTVSNPGVPE